VRDVHPFIQRLYDLAEHDNRAALAELRRSFATPLSAMPYVVPFLRADATRREEDALVLVAGLFALHPSKGTLSLARALAIVARTSDSVALRFRALLDADIEDLAHHLRHAVTLVRSHELAVDFDDLLNTVRWWDGEDKNRQRAWARDFWGTPETNEETAT
jgi:CRISPR system Cascade subunit CasB